MKCVVYVFWNGTNMNEACVNVTEMVERANMVGAVA